MHKSYIIILLGVFVVVGALVTQLRKSPSVSLDGFAQCLRDKGITMYGANWCPHCQNEKRAFGKAFKFVSYVECPADPNKCIAAGITGYPTWIFPDGKKLIGEQGIEKLAKESGCVLSQFTINN